MKNTFKIIFLFFIFIAFVFIIQFFMQNNNRQNADFLNDQKIMKIIDKRKTKHKLYIQLRIIQKIISSIVWIDSYKLTEDVIYQISKYVFKNPLSFHSPIYKRIDSQHLKIHQKKSYILLNNELQIEVVKNLENRNQKFLKAQIKKNYPGSEEYEHIKMKKGEYSVNIKVIRCWKGCGIEYSLTSFKQIIKKSRHLIDFLKNIKIDDPKQRIQQNQKFYESQNLQEKELKFYTLICQNYDYVYSQITQIQENQQLKRMDNFIARTYVETMNRNMIILNVQKNNFNPISYKSEGKFLYIENSFQLPLYSQKFVRLYEKIQSFELHPSLLKLIPHLECNKEGQWNVINELQGTLQLFEQSGKRLDRNQGLIIDAESNCYEYDDFLLKQI